ncbi:MAG: LysM peptidoglycan-binding domain-containing protein [Acidimicrobiia bacterium]|nr:LysM peptidoglycan-binding domain-containing protein [Acidimicrobiia bacterium]
MTAVTPTFDFPADRSSASAPRRYLIPPRVVAVLAIVAFVSVLMTSVSADQPVVTVDYTVGQGDTLWGIASSVTEPGSDVRETLVVVRELNDLSGSTIHAGQILRLPAG